MSRIAILVAAIEVVVGVVAAVTVPPGDTTGWGGAVTDLVFVAVTLLAIGWALRSTRRGVAVAAAAVALILAIANATVLLGYFFWGGDWKTFSLHDKVFQLLFFVPPTLVFIAAFIVELPPVQRHAATGG